MRLGAAKIIMGGIKGKGSDAIISKLRSPTMLGYKEAESYLVPALQPQCTCNISRVEEH